MGTGSCEGFNEVRREGILKRPLRGFARRAPTRLGRFLLDSFPFEFSWQRFGEDNRRTGIPKVTAKCPIRFNVGYFWRFVAPNDGVRRVTAGKEFTRPRAQYGRASSPPRRAITTARWHSVSWAIPAVAGGGSRLNPDVTVDPPLSRSNPCNNHNTTGCPPWCNSRLIRSSPNSKTP